MPRRLNRFLVVQKIEIVGREKTCMLWFGAVLGMLVACGSNVLTNLEAVRPSKGQTLLRRGSADVSRGIRTVTGSVDATGHGPVAYYAGPFRRENSLCL